MKRIDSISLYFISMICSSAIISFGLITTKNYWIGSSLVDSKCTSVIRRQESKNSQQYQSRKLLKHRRINSSPVLMSLVDTSAVFSEIQTKNISSDSLPTINLSVGVQQSTSKLHKMNKTIVKFQIKKEINQYQSSQSSSVDTNTTTNTNNINNNIIAFTILGDPTPLPRHRMAKGRMYNPSAKEQKNFATECKQYLPDIPLKGSLEVTLLFYFRRPKNHYGTGKNSDVLKSSIVYAGIWHKKRPGMV